MTSYLLICWRCLNCFLQLCLKSLWMGWTRTVYVKPCSAHDNFTFYGFNSDDSPTQEFIFMLMKIVLSILLWIHQNKKVWSFKTLLVKGNLFVRKQKMNKFKLLMIKLPISIGHVKFDDRFKTEGNLLRIFAIPTQS